MDENNLDKVESGEDMYIHRIPVFWMMGGYIETKLPTVKVSLDEYYQIMKKSGLPLGSYIGDSCQIDEDLLLDESAGYGFIGKADGQK